MVQDAQTYARWDMGLSNRCPFCITGMNEGDNGLEERSCPKCRPFYKQDLLGKKLPPRIKETGASFRFLRWAIIKRAETDSAEADWSLEKRRQLVDDITAIWVYGYVPAQQAAQTEQAAGAAIASRSTY